jgi:hypothetical protein
LYLQECEEAVSAMAAGCLRDIVVDREGHGASLRGDRDRSMEVVVLVGGWRTMVFVAGRKVRGEVTLDVAKS